MEPKAPPTSSGPLPSPPVQRPLSSTALVFGVLAGAAGGAALWFWTAIGSANLLVSLVLLGSFVALAVVWLVLLSLAAAQRRIGRAWTWLLVPLFLGGSLLLVVSGVGSRVRFAYARPRLEAAAKAVLASPTLADSYEQTRIGGEFVSHIDVTNGSVYFHLPGVVLNWTVLVYAPAGPPASFHRQLGPYRSLGGGWFEYEYKF